MNAVSRARTFLDALADAIESASSHNRQDQVPPAAVLWTDESRQWEELLASCSRNRLPLFVSRQSTPQTITFWPGLLAEVHYCADDSSPGSTNGEGARTLPARLFSTGHAGVGDLSSRVAALG